jgi:DNA replication protein DnaC
MLKELRACRADGTHERRLARYASVDLLIIDDLGLRALTGEEPIDLYDIIRQRYEKASTMITSNRALEEWAPLFNDPLLANAAMDRLLHHAVVVQIEGASYRLRQHADLVPEHVRSKALITPAPKRRGRPPARKANDYQNG